jgi:hypothetical protein
LGFNPSLINPRQICQAIAPLAETLFPTPRVPVFRTHLNEGWIVFEESSRTNVKPLRLGKRTTLTSYSNSDKGLSVNVPPGEDGSILSAPLRHTGGELGGNTPNREVPNSAETGASQGKKSFLRPFLLGGRKKQRVEIPAAVMHKSRKEEEFDIPKSQVGYQGMADGRLQVDLETPETPYEDSAEISKHDDSQPSPVWAPLGKGKKGTSKRVAEIRVDEGDPTSPGVMTPMSAKAPPTPTTITPVTPVSQSNVLSPVPTPSTAFIQLTPIEGDIPFSPVPITPITPSPAITIAPLAMRSTPNTPLATTPTIPTSKSTAQRESGRPSDLGGDRLRHHHRKPEETSDERRKRKERERRSERGSEGEKRSRSSRSEDVEKEDTWLEIVFEDLPFGPDKNMVSPLPFPQPTLP